MKNISNIQKQLNLVDRRLALCTVSGGLDSAVAMAFIANMGFRLVFIFFDWGQKTLVKELECAEALANHYSAEIKIIEVPMLKTLPGISLTKAETLTTEINEYVPNRNAIIETQSIAYAEYLKAGVLCVGSTGGDHICPDNSPEFIKKMQALIDTGTMLKPTIKIVAPLIYTDKIGAVKLGKELLVPFELTWSCHNNIENACGKCSNCISRLEAFELNNIKDPIRYE